MSILSETVSNCQYIESTLSQEYSSTLTQLSELETSHGYSAAVFTQTTDVEGELNGFFTYDRSVTVWNCQ